MLVKNKKSGIIGRFCGHSVGFVKDGAMDMRPCVRVKDKETNNDYFLTYDTIKDFCNAWKDAGIDEEPEDGEEHD